MQAESDIYFKTTQLIDFLSKWKDTSTSLPQAVEKLWIALYERTYIEIKDVVAMQLWLSAIADSGYIFPPLQATNTLQYLLPLASTTLLIHFNYNTNLEQSEQSVNMWSQLCPESNIILALPHTDSAAAHGGNNEGVGAVYPIPEKANATVRTIRYVSDKGFYSPLYNIIKVIQESTKTNGKATGEMLVSSHRFQAVKAI